MATKSGVFAGKGIGRERNPKDAVRATIYLTRDEHRRMKRLLFELEEKGVRVSLTALTRAALRRAAKKLEGAPQPLTQEEALALVED